MAKGQGAAKGTGRRGVSKGQWLDAGLDALASGSVSEITIERLARSLGIAKAGFYWHFENREDLLRQMLDHWAHELTGVVTSNAQLRELEPRSRLISTAEMILDYDLADLDMAIRQWALQNADAARAVRKVTRMRLDFVCSALSELGFRGDDAEMRAMLFVVYHSWESSTFRWISRKRRRELIESRIDLLIRR